MYYILMSSILYDLYDLLYDFLSTFIPKVKRLDRKFGVVEYK